MAELTFVMSSEGRSPFLKIEWHGPRSHGYDHSTGLKRKGRHGAISLKVALDEQEVGHAVTMTSGSMCCGFRGGAGVYARRV